MGDLPAMLMFEAGSMDEARAIVAKYPLVKNGCLILEIYHWCVVEK
ncbi:YciI family protein [Tychonema sp. BBK16]|nr:YciI family protein [Tychonema sp. BBK16]MCF6372994.1 YciI family protein [Tychonema sp. BBK16]